MDVAHGAKLNDALDHGIHSRWRNEVLRLRLVHISSGQREVCGVLLSRIHVRVQRHRVPRVFLKTWNGFSSGMVCVMRTRIPGTSGRSPGRPPVAWSCRWSHASGMVPCFCRPAISSGALADGLAPVGGLQRACSPPPPLGRSPRSSWPYVSA